jgi:hypothetical protein
VARRLDSDTAAVVGNGRLDTSSANQPGYVVYSLAAQSAD